jgi:hypothetical protein
MVPHPHTGVLVRKSELLAQKIDPETGAYLPVSLVSFLSEEGLH